MRAPADLLEEAREAYASGVEPELLVETYGPELRDHGRVGDLEDVLDEHEHGVLWDWIRGTATNGDGPSSGVQVWDFAELAADPELTKPPEEVVPRLAYREHTTLMSSDPKGGKTTLAAAASAAVANGDPFLGRSTPQGQVLWVKGEGHRRMIFEYLNRFGAEPVADRIQIAESGMEPLKELESLVGQYDPDLVVIDTWTSWTAPLDLDYWKAADVALPLRRLEQVARGGPGIILLHHNRRSDGQPRGSGHIMAAVDLLRTVEEGEHERERKITGRGRVPVEPFRYRLVDSGDVSRLEVVDPEREVENKILDFLEANENATKRSIRDGVSAANAAIEEALSTLEQEGIVQVDRSGIAHEHRIAQDPHRHATGTDRHGSRHGNSGSEVGTVPQEGAGPRSGPPPEAHPTDPDSGGEE